MVASHMHPTTGTEPATQACALTGNRTSELLLCGTVDSKQLSDTGQGYRQLIFDKGAKTLQWGKTVFSANGAGKTGYPRAKNEVGP